MLWIANQPCYLPVTKYFPIRNNCHYGVNGSSEFFNIWFQYFGISVLHPAKLLIHFIVYVLFG